MDYHTIQTLNEAWRDAIKFHLITQRFQHPQTTVKCPSFVLPANVFHFSLKEIGNLLGRLAILTNEGSVRTVILKVTDRRTSGSLNALLRRVVILWPLPWTVNSLSLACSHRLDKTSEMSWEIPTQEFTEENRITAAEGFVDYEANTLLVYLKRILNIFGECRTNFMRPVFKWHKIYSN